VCPTPRTMLWEATPQKGVVLDAARAVGTRHSPMGRTLLCLCISGVHLTTSDDPITDGARMLHVQCSLISEQVPAGKCRAS
jgi:hypothetical protein